MRAKKQQYKREMTIEQNKYKEYRFYDGSDMVRDMVREDVREEFGDYGYCFFTIVSCPLDNSDNSQINEIRCMGNYCNKDSTIEKIFGSADDAIAKLASNNSFRCLENMEDTLCNRCISCNSTHRSELVAAQHDDVSKCGICDSSYNLNLESASEHTLTYLILGKLIGLFIQE